MSIIWNFSVDIGFLKFSILIQGNKLPVVFLKAFSQLWLISTLSMTKMQFRITACSSTPYNNYLTKNKVNSCTSSPVQALHHIHLHSHYHALRLHLLVLEFILPLYTYLLLLTTHIIYHTIHKLTLNENERRWELIVCFCILPKFKTGISHLFSLLIR